MLSWEMGNGGDPWQALGWTFYCCRPLTASFLFLSSGILTAKQARLVVYQKCKTRYIRLVSALPNTMYVLDSHTPELMIIILVKPKFNIWSFKKGWKVTKDCLTLKKREACMCQDWWCQACQGPEASIEASKQAGTTFHSWVSVILAALKILAPLKILPELKILAPLKIEMQENTKHSPKDFPLRLVVSNKQKHEQTQCTTKAHKKSTRLK